ncbi:PREDICTED: uncharacterized protein LOC109476226 [Branchiostoma belcheri]|uniref:Uncharacterized protein LOC109476226 n=1 Tax=Branchiostoma belcheri TaxID=7741 RepID=A0A6P4Z7P7_BRABE|nr:PREDICTED: uncharacterized protein LOC109476226 [Branchiostoma belcheri]
MAPGAVVLVCCACLVSVCAADKLICPEGASPGDEECTYIVAICNAPDRPTKCEEQLDSICIPAESWCDGVVDCVRGSDEKDCGSGGCIDCWGGGQCIPSYLWCNGRPDCPGGSDEKFCSECSANEFQCESSSICVPWSRVCDAVNDCGDGSDETCGVSAAEEPWCLPGEYACGSGMCVSDSARCDGVEDCDDDSDEARCECTSAEFRCETSLQCVPSAAICDGIDDCGDGSDELLCMTCEERRMWECPGGECIDPSSVCDGDKDCSLREDERNCQRPCNDMQFQCDDGSCLTQYLVCDEVANCPSGEEEINCTIGGCNAARQFRCPDGSCLSERDLCNRREDCSGGEDEMDCGDPAPPGFPVGMASRYIPDHAVTASSELKSEFAAYRGRLGGDLTATSCWAPREAENQWIQVDFGKTTNVTGVIISGGSQSFEHFSWVTSFTLAFSTDGARWEPYTGRDGDVQVFPGNRDRHRKVSRPLDHPVTARYIRLYPTGYQGWVALNMEVYVTNDEDNWLEQEDYTSLVVSEYDMSASSRTDGSYPHQARLNNGRGQQQGAAWSPDPALRSIPWLQVTHDALYRVAGVITQGAYNLDHWVTSYKLEFSPDCQKRTPYTNSDDEMIVFEGNTDNQRYVRNLLDNPVFARCTRFHPIAYHNQVALRVQVLVMQGKKVLADSVQHQGQGVRIMQCCVQGDANPRGDSVPYLEDVCRASTSTATKIDSQFNECRYTLEDFESGLVDPVGGFESGPLAPSNIQAGPGLSGGFEQVPGLSGGFEQVPGLSGGIEQVPGLSGGIEQVPGLSGGFEQVPVPSGGIEQVPVPSGGIEQVPVIRRKRALEKFHDTQACDGIIDCSTGKDEDNCEKMECVLQCETESGDPCIPARWICDDTEDCLGGEDEQGCNDAQASRGCFFKCTPNGFSLFSEICVPPHELGDGYESCELGKDEDPRQVELALEKWFGSCSYVCASVYGNASCVPDVFVCDGLTDCLDGEDEQSCSEETCLTLFCDLPGVPVPVCVPDNLICDGHADCRSAEDEKVPRCRPDSLLDPFVDRPLAGKPEREGPIAGLEPEEGPRLGQEEGPRVHPEEGPRSGQEEGPRFRQEEGPRFRQEEGPRVGQDGTAEPSGGSPEKQSEFYAGNGGTGDRAAFWLTAAGLGLQIIYLY